MKCLKILFLMSSLLLAKPPDPIDPDPRIRKGTYGVQVESIPDTLWLQRGDLFGTLSGLEESSNFRTNITLVWKTEPVFFVLECFSETGEKIFELRESSLTYEPTNDGVYQFNTPIQSTEYRGRFNCKVFTFSDKGQFVLYSTVIDNSTGDGTFNYMYRYTFSGKVYNVKGEM